jgi:hypothetical protein
MPLSEATRAQSNQTTDASTPPFTAVLSGRRRIAETLGSTPVRDVVMVSTENASGLRAVLGLSRDAAVEKTEPLAEEK